MGFNQADHVIAEGEESLFQLVHQFAGVIKIRGWR